MQILLDVMQVWNSCTMRRDEDERKEYLFSEEKKDAGVEWGGSASKHPIWPCSEFLGFS
jgi:hypothetical protein